MSDHPNAAPEREPESWRCFHCDEVFTDRASASDHFGRTMLAEPACGIDAGRVRELEAQLERYHNEDSDLDRRYHAMQAEHAAALRRAEEEGYARGLADAPAGLREANERADRLAESAARAEERIGALIAWLRHATCTGHNPDVVHAEPQRFGIAREECAGGLAYFPLGFDAHGASGLGPARTFEAAIEQKIAEYSGAGAEVPHG